MIQSSLINPTCCNPLTSKTNSHPAVTYSYDNIGRMLSLTDQEGATTQFAYNNRGLVTGKTDPLGLSSGFIYDDAGRLTTKTDRKNQSINYEYTSSDKISKITYPDASTVNYTYNNLDNLVSMQDSTGTTQYAYDAAGRLTSMTNPQGLVVSYSYDEAGNVTGLTYPGGKKVIYTYDDLNRPASVKIDWLNLTAIYGYDEAGRMIGYNNFNNTVNVFAYDNANRLTGMQSKDSAGLLYNHYAFTLDGNGNRTGLMQLEPFSYSDYLTAANDSYTYNAQKTRMLTAGAYTFSYDDEGQLSTGYSQSFGFDYEHRLKNIGTAYQFTYDGKGNRVQTVKNGVTTRYLYDASGNLLAETDGNNTITRYYIYGKGLQAMVTPQNQVYCYHYNATGSTIALSDMSQNMVNAYTFDPFGNGLQIENVPQPFKFVGQFGVYTDMTGF